MTRTTDVNTELTEKVNEFKDTGLTFSIGDEIKPDYTDLVTVLKYLYTGGYTRRLQLVQTAVDHDLLFTGGSKEVYHSLVPQIVNRMEYLVSRNEFDVYEPDNYRVVVCVYVLSWYWYHHLSGPRPKVKGLKDVQSKRLIIQNEPLECPLCYKKFIPPPSVRQDTKAWAYARWLPDHFVRYHYYPNPKDFDKFIKPESKTIRTKFNDWYKKEKASWTKKGGTK